MSEEDFLIRLNSIAFSAFGPNSIWHKGSRYSRIKHLEERILDLEQLKHNYPKWTDYRYIVYSVMADLIRSKSDSIK